MNPRQAVIRLSLGCGERCRGPGLEDSRRSSKVQNQSCLRSADWSLESSLESGGPLEGVPKGKERRMKEKRSKMSSEVRRDDASLRKRQDELGGPEGRREFEEDKSVIERRPEGRIRQVRTED